MTGVEIAEKLGISKTTVYNKLRKVNVKIRNNKEAQKFAYFRGRFNNNNHPKPIAYPRSIKEKVAEAYAIGAVMGDGYVSSKAVRLKVTRKDFRDGFARCIKTAYHFQPNIREKGNIYVCDVCRILVAKRIRCLTEDLKEVPNFVMDGSQKIKAGFIKGFSDAEGCFDDSHNKRQIVITQKDTKILERIQKLLLDLKIQSIIYRKTKNPDQLVISLLRNLRRYKDMISFDIGYKEKKLRKAIEYLDNYAYDTNAYWNCLRKWEEYETSFRNLARILNIKWGTIRSWIRGVRMPRQIKKDIQYKDVPKDYGKLQREFSFLPKISKIVLMK